MRYALRGSVSGELLTYQGRVLVHDSRGELEWLFPGERVVPYDGDLPTMSVAEHPDMAPIIWPLNRKDFR
jgi:hypothetical protein